jgi:hypothetical protein
MMIARPVWLVVLVGLSAGCAGLSEPVAVGEDASPVLLQHTEFNNADRTFQLSDSFGHRPFRASADYRTPDNSAHVRLDVQKFQGRHSLKEILEILDRVGIENAESCEFETKNPDFPKAGDSLERAIGRPLAGGEILESNSVPVRRIANQTDVNDIRFIWAEIGTEKCLSFAQCLQRRTIPDGKSVGYLTGHFCFPADKTFDFHASRDLLKGIVVRSDLIPAR